jgi:hypothetical protein
MVRLLTYFFLTLFLLGQTASLASETEAAVASEWESFAFRIEDSRSFVGIAPVYLSVSKLEPKDGKLVGTYSIRVPLRSSKNDKGIIVLPLDVRVSDLGAKGGVLRGKAHSQTDEGVVSDIVCVILPEKDQAIKLAITTKKRTINFESRYSIIELSQDG